MDKLVNILRGRKEGGEKQGRSSYLGSVCDLFNSSDSVVFCKGNEKKNANNGGR